MAEMVFVNLWENNHAYDFERFTWSVIMYSFSLDQKESQCIMLLFKQFYVLLFLNQSILINFVF